MTEWDPNSAYSAGGPQPDDPRVDAASRRGYTTPPHVQEQFIDPLISPNYNGWWSRGVSIAQRGWKPLAALQAVGVVLVLLVQAPVAAYAALASEDLTRTLGP